MAEKPAGSAPTPPQPALVPPLRGTRASCGGRIFAVATLLAVAAYGASYYASSGGRARPERVTLVPQSLAQVSPVSMAPASSSAVSPPAAPCRFNPAYCRSKSGTVLWPHTKGPGPYGL